MGGVALSSESRAYVELKATGILRALGHDVTLSAPVEGWEAAIDDESAIDAPVEVRIPVARLEAPADLSSSDREKMIDNMRGPAVLDAARWPAIVFRGRYRGSLDGGTLEGDLEVRGSPRAMTIPIRIARLADDRLRATGAWTGTLTALGIKPFKALLGALRLEDWARIRLDVIVLKR
jgi:polyisoprenoid-binding protein YceI